MNAMTGGASEPAGTATERLLRTRVAELEAEVDELRDAARGARDLAAAAGAAQAALHEEIAALQARVAKLSTVRGSLRALQRAALHRAHDRDADGDQGPDYRRSDA